MALADAKSAAIWVYLLGEASGNALDDIGSLDLTETSTVGSTSGLLGNARDFDGSADLFSRASSADFTFSDEDWGISAWVRLDDKSSGRGIVGKFNVSDEYTCYYSSSSDRFRFDNDRVGIVDTAYGSPSTGSWHLVVFGYDSVANEYYLYVNGGSNKTVASSSLGLVANASNPFIIGAVRTTPTFPMDGQIQEVVGVRGYAFTATDVDALWNGGAGVSFADWDAGGGTTTTPAAVSCTASVVAPAVLLTHGPATVACTTSTPSIVVELRQSATPTTLAALVAAPATTLTQSATPVAIASSVPSVTTASGTVTSPDPVAATASNPTPATALAHAVSPVTAQTQVAAQATSLLFGALPAIMAASVPEITPSLIALPAAITLASSVPVPGSVLLRAMSPISATLAVPSVTVQVGDEPEDRTPAIVFNGARRDLTFNGEPRSLTFAGRL